VKANEERVEALAAIMRAAVEENPRITAGALLVIAHRHDPAARSGAPFNSAGRPARA
jgi:hypothetical protein